MKIKILKDCVWANVKPHLPQIQFKEGQIYEALGSHEAIARRLLETGNAIECEKTVDQATPVVKEKKAVKALKNKAVTDIDNKNEGAAEKKATPEKVEDKVNG